nr:immunoglobulin heavy chain junction region [Macaca mulatta]MOV36475.1 immunoglobulin heavy chain junction region [Macaca mulatta]
CGRDAWGAGFDYW